MIEDDEETLILMLYDLMDGGDHILDPTGTRCDRASGVRCQKKKIGLPCDGTIKGWKFDPHQTLIYGPLIKEK